MPPTEVSGNSHSLRQFRAFRTTKVALPTQNRSIRCSRLKRQRAHMRLLPLQHNDHSHQGAYGASGIPSKLSSPPASPKGCGPDLHRPKATKQIKPSTSRRSCCSPAAQPTGNPLATNRPFCSQKPRPVRRCVPQWTPEGTHARAHSRRIRARPRVVPEGTTPGRAIRVVETTSVLGSVSGTEAPIILRGTPAEATPHAHIRTPTEARTWTAPNHSPARARRYAPARRDSLFKEPRHACPPGRRAIEASQTGPVRKPAPYRILPLAETSFRKTAPVPDPSHGSYTDGARQQIECPTHDLLAASPEGESTKKAARSEGSTTPPRVRCLSTEQVVAIVTTPAYHTDAFRSQGFSPSQRLNPTTAARLCFTPHPSIGFWPSELFPLGQPRGLSALRALLSSSHSFVHNFGRCVGEPTQTFCHTVPRGSDFRALIQPSIRHPSRRG